MTTTFHLGEAASVGFGTVPFWHVCAPPRGVRRPIERFTRDPDT